MNPALIILLLAGGVSSGPPPAVTTGGTLDEFDYSEYGQEGQNAVLPNWAYGEQPRQNLARTFVLKGRTTTRQYIEGKPGTGGGATP